MYSTNHNRRCKDLVPIGNQSYAGRGNIKSNVSNVTRILETAEFYGQFKNRDLFIYR